MLHYKTNEISQKLGYKFLSGSIIPRPIAWVTTLNQETGIANAAPFSFFNAVASDIPLVSLAILRKEGKLKDTAANILQTEELVIHLVNESIIEQMNQTAANLSPDISELHLNNIETVESHSVKAPSIKNVPIRMEARLHQYVPIKDEAGEIITDMFVVKITDFFFESFVFDEEKEYILAEKFNPVARLSGSTYATIDQYFDLERPN